MSDQDFFIHLGRVIEAHRNRAFMRTKAKSADAEIEAAQSHVRAFGMYDDCGPGYLEDLAIARGVAGFAVQMKVSSEKNYKAVKMSFLEAHGVRAEEALATHLSVQVPENALKEDDGFAPQ